MNPKNDPREFKTIPLESLEPGPVEYQSEVDRRERAQREKTAPKAKPHVSRAVVSPRRAAAERARLVETDADRARAERPSRRRNPRGGLSDKSRQTHSLKSASKKTAKTTRAALKAIFGGGAPQ